MWLRLAKKATQNEYASIIGCGKRPTLHEQGFP